MDNENFCKNISMIKIKVKYIDNENFVKNIYS